jgi:hypothetical protein
MMRQRTWNLSADGAHPSAHLWPWPLRWGGSRLPVSANFQRFHLDGLAQKTPQPRRGRRHLRLTPAEAASRTRESARLGATKHWPRKPRTFSPGCVQALRFGLMALAPRVPPPPESGLRPAPAAIARRARRRQRLEVHGATQFSLRAPARQNPQTFGSAPAAPRPGHLAPAPAGCGGFVATAGRH